MSNVPTETLNGLALDYACAKAQGYGFTTDTISHLAYEPATPNKVLQLGYVHANGYAPSRCWTLGGDIITDRKITVAHDDIQQLWVGIVINSQGSALKATGHTPLTAAMRAFVKTQFGDTIWVPEAILRQSKSQLEMAARVVSARGYATAQN